MNFCLRASLRHCRRAVQAGIGTIALALVCSTVLITRPTPAFARIQISEDSPHASLWRRVYDQIPAAWKPDRLVVVQEISPAEMDRMVDEAEGNDRAENDDSVVDGFYQGGGENEDDPAMIMLRDSLRGEAAELVFTHEYGHFVWDEVLTGAQHARYRRLWREQKRAHHLVTHYAADSPEEGFAEDFSYFLRRPDVLRRRNAAAADFLRSLLPDKARAQHQ